MSTVQCFLFFLCFSSSPLTLFSLSLSSPVRKDLCICLYRCVYWCKCLRSTTTVICFLEVAEGIQTVCIRESAMQRFFFFVFFFYLSSFSLKRRMRQLGSHSALFLVIAKQIAHFKECTFLYLCIPSTASQGLRLISLFTIALQNIRFKKKRVGTKKRKKEAFAVSFSKEFVYSLQIYLNIGEYINLFTFCVIDIDRKSVV